MRAKRLLAATVFSVALAAAHGHAAADDVAVGVVVKSTPARST